MEKELVRVQSSIKVKTHRRARIGSKFSDSCCNPDRKVYIVAKELEGFVARLTALGGGSGDSRDVYEDWAPTYEQNLQQDYGYIAPQLTVDVFVRYCLDKNIRILDLGCGTGLVGVELSKRGYNRFDGLDVSLGMLDVARSKKIYGDLFVGDMTQPIDLGGRNYDAAIAVGCFGGGHIGPEHLANIINCVTAGGILVLYINGIPYDEDDYAKHFASLEADGICRVRAEERSNYMQSLERPGWAVVLQRAEQHA